VTDVSRYERDTLLEAIHAGDAGRVARWVASLKAEGEPLPLLLWVLAEGAAAHDGAGRQPAAAPASSRPTAWRRCRQTTRRHGAASFDRELLRAHRIDRMIKGIETGDPCDSVIELALGIAGKPVLAAA
jgi:DNA polymerase-3 subunit delta